MFNEIDSIEERYWTTVAMMRHLMAQQQRTAAGDSKVKAPWWHALDDPMTRDQRDTIPDGGSHETRSVPLWLKFRHPERLWDIVVSRGQFDFDDDTWTARLRPDDNVGRRGPVIPESWALIVPGEPPPEWVGPMIQRRRDT